MLLIKVLSMYFWYILILFFIFRSFLGCDSTYFLCKISMEQHVPNSKETKCCETSLLCVNVNLSRFWKFYHECNTETYVSQFFCILYSKYKNFLLVNVSNFHECYFSSRKREWAFLSWEQAVECRQNLWYKRWLELSDSATRRMGNTVY